MSKRGNIQGIGLAVAIVLWIGMQTPAYSQGSGPEIGPLRVMTPDPIERYAPFEVAFDITNSAATNPYWPYEANTPAGVPPGVGINVDMSLLPPGSGDWAGALTLPCFYYQPVEELGVGAQAGLAPVGPAEWRCRFTPELDGAWQYRIRATDAGGTVESAAA